MILVNDKPMDLLKCYADFIDRDKCFKFNDEKVKWAEANSRCLDATKPYSLASLHSLEEQSKQPNPATLSFFTKLSPTSFRVYFKNNVLTKGIKCNLDP